MVLRVFDFADGFSSANAPTELGGITIVANQAIGASGTITPSSAVRQLLKVSGSGGAQTASTTPFASNPLDGTKIILHGTDGTNTLTIVHNDATSGCILNGDATLGANDELTLVYDETAGRYYEESRNF